MIESKERNVAETLKELRKEKGYTLQKVADAIGCSPSYLHRLENSSRKNPSMRVVTQLAEFYDADMALITGVSISSNDTVPTDTLVEELGKASLNIKQGIQLLEKGDVSKEEEMRHLFIEAQKSLLYMQSLL